VERKIFDRLRALTLLGNLLALKLGRIGLLWLLLLLGLLLRLEGLVIPGALLPLGVKFGQFLLTLGGLLLAPFCQPTRRLFDGERVVFLAGLVGDLDLDRRRIEWVSAPCLLKLLGAKLLKANNSSRIARPRE
jgi:hypothetical protein